MQKSQWTPGADFRFPPNGALFYPSCGQDLMLPLQLFKEVIDVFWFVDRDYLPYIFGDRPVDANDCDWLLNDPDFRPLDFQVQGSLYSTISRRYDPGTKRVRQWLDPCIRTERYMHHTGRVITINRKRGFGTPTLAKIESLSVFYYRGDSEGESGSGDRWFNWYGEQIAHELTDPGLIVTDGSNLYRGSQDRKWGRLVRRPIGEPSETPPPFSKYGRRFKCLSHFGSEHRPTYVWQVRKMDHD